MVKEKCEENSKTSLFGKQFFNELNTFCEKTQSEQTPGPYSVNTAYERRSKWDRQGYSRGLSSPGMT